MLVQHQGCLQISSKVCDRVCDLISQELALNVSLQLLLGLELSIHRSTSCTWVSQWGFAVGTTECFQLCKSSGLTMRVNSHSTMGAMKKLSGYNHVWIFPSLPSNAKSTDG